MPGRGSLIELRICLGVSAVAGLVLLAYYLQWMPDGLAKMFAERTPVWFFFLGAFLVMAGIHYLRFRSERTGSVLAGIVATVAGASISGIFLVGLYAWLCLLAGALVSDMLVSWLRERLPSGLGDYLIGPDVFYYVSGAIAAIIAVTAASVFAYRRLRKQEELTESFEPILSIFVLFGVSVFLVLMLMFITFVPLMAANAFGFTGFEEWLRSHFGRVVGLGLIAALGIIWGLYLRRRRHPPDWETKGQTLLGSVGSVWVAVFVGLGCGLLAMIAIVVLKANGAI
jgi:hypothetical protein